MAEPLPDLDETLKRAKAKRAAPPAETTAPKPAEAAPPTALPDLDEALARGKGKPRLPSTHLPAFANPYEALGAVEKARQQHEDRLIEEGANPLDARRVSTDAAARLLVYPAERRGKLVDAVIATGEQPPTLATTATRVLGPGVRGITPGAPKTRAERDEEYQNLVAQYDASWGALDAATAMFHKVWSPDPTKMEAQSEQDKTSRAWMDNLTEYLKETAGDYYKNLFVVPAALERAYTATTEGDPFAREKRRAKLGMEVAQGVVTDPDVQTVASPSGVVGLAKRAGARLEAAVPGAAYLEAAAQALGNGGHISPTDVQTIRQKIRDSVPDDVFDNEIAPVVRAASESKDPESWLAAQEAILATAPIAIPDASQYNAPDVRKFRSAYEANPSAFAGDAWADFRHRMEQKADDGEVQTALRLVPFGQLMTVQDNVAPTVDMLAALANRRGKAREDTGGVQVDALLRLLGTAATKPVVVEGQIASVESRAAWAMRLAGAAFQTLAEADVPLGELPPVRVVAAIADKAGASQLADQFRATRIPTPRGVDRMLATGAWDDALRYVGLGPYRPLLGDDGSTLAARVLADLTLPEYQGFQWGNQAIRAGAEPTGTLVSSLDVLDLVGQFLVPTESIVGAIPGAAIRGVARAAVGAGEMPKGYKLVGALAKAAPATYSIVADVPLRDLDGDTALRHALRESVLDMVKQGRDPASELPPGVLDNVKNGLRSLGVDPDAALADLSKHAQWRRARIVDTTQNLLAMSATPEQEALRQTPGHIARAAEYDALVQAGTLTPEQAKVGLRLDEVRAFLLTDAGKVASPEAYFGQVSREVGGTSGAGAYFQGEPVAGTGPAFRAWFGDSKVVDENGAPKVVYHGTARAGFDTFDAYGSEYGLFGQGSYFTEDPDIASSYTEKGKARMARRGEEPSEGVYPALLSIKNPMDMDAPADVAVWREAPIVDRYGADIRDGMTNEQAYRAVEDAIIEQGDVPKYEAAAEIQDVIREMGHDGITHIGGGRVGDKPHRVYIAFDPEQIKSAIGNRGTFDPNDPNILHSTISGKQTEQGTIERVVKKGHLGADMPRLLDLLGASMYNKPLAEVATKELVQNAFDAVKGVRPEGADAPAINVRMVTTDRTIAVSDNGRGMTPEIVQNALFTIGGTNKSHLAVNQRSGGLGLAKMAFLFGSEWVDVNTVRDGVRTLVHATADQIKASDFDIITEPAPSVPNGTTVTVKLPESYIDPKTGESTPIYFYPPGHASEYSFLGKPMIGDVDVTFDIVPKYGKNTNMTLPIGRNRDQSSMPLLTKVSFSWGDADVYMGRVRTETPKHDVLSAGLHQFQALFSDPQSYKAVPYDIVVDVHPNVEPTSATYPFNNQREGWRGTIKADVDALTKYLSQHASGIAAKETAERFSNAVAMPRVDLSAIGATNPREIATAVGSFAAGKSGTKRVVPTGAAVPTIRISDGEVRVATESERAAPASFEAEVPASSIEEVRGSVAIDPKVPLFHNNTSADFIRAVRAKNPSAIPEVFFSELGSAVLAFKERMAKLGGYTYAELLSPHDPYAAGISIDKGYHGVHVRVPYRAFFLNPLACTARHARGAAESMLHTLVHEAAHTVTMAHNETFASTLASAYDLLGDSGDVDTFRDVLRSIMDKHWSTFEEMRRIYDDPSTRNLAGSMADRAELPRTEPGRGTSVGAEGPRNDVGGGERIGSSESAVSGGDLRTGEQDVAGSEQPARDVIKALFQKVGPTIRGSIEPVTIGYLQRFFQTADFNTLLHEDGHLLRFLFGDDWTSSLAKHFDHDPATGKLTRTGEEQAAEALRYWFRTRLAPNGRLRSYFEQADLALRNLWLGLRNEPELLPAELRTMFDATLRPDDAVRPSAVALVDEEALPRPRLRVTTPADTPEGRVAAVVDNPVLKKGRAVAASRVRTDPEAVRIALGLNADAFGTDLPVDEVVAGLVAHTGVEHARQRWTGEDLKAITERSVVPASRIPRVRADVTADLRQTLGTEVRDLIQPDGSARFNDVQAASVYGLISRLADSPVWRGLSEDALAFNPTNGDRVLSPEGWRSVQETLTDLHAGVGSTRNAVAEASQASVLTAFARGVRDSLVALDPAGDRHIRDLVEGYERRFIVDAGRGTYGTPEMHTAQDKALRSLGEVPTEVKAMVRAARANDKAGVKSLGELLATALPHVSPDIPPTVAPDLLTWHRKLSGEGDTARKVARDRARQEAELAAAGGSYTPGAMASADMLDLATLTDPNTLDELTVLLSASPGGMTDREVAAIDWLRRLGAAPSPGRIDALTPFITDAVSIVQTGITRRWEAVKDAAARIIQCGAGSDDAAVLERLGVDEAGQAAADNAYVLAYQHFHNGDFVGTKTGLFKLLGERGGLKVIGPEYNQGAALLAMFTQLRSLQILRDYAAEITAMGLGLNPDQLEVRGTTTSARAPKRYVIGSRPEGADNFAQRVLEQVNAVVSWHATETQQQRAGGGLLAPRPAEGASAPIGLENMEAATKAMEILDMAGWPIGKGIFNQTPVVFSDGSTLLIPEMFKKEIDETLKKTAKVGTAYVEASSGEVARKLGLLRDERVGRATGYTPEEQAELARLKKARAVGAAVGGVAGALGSGPIGAGVGAMIGGSVAPEVVATATTVGESAARLAQRALGGGEGPARVAGQVAGAGLGAAKAAARAPIELALKTWTGTTRLARLGMTTGLALPNFSSFFGNLWGAFFQSGQGLGWGGATRAWFSEPRFVGDVVARLWGDGPTNYRIGSRPIVTDDGRVLTAQQVVDDFVHRGMDSSYPKAESSNALYADAEAQVGRWLDRFLKTPGAAVLEPLSGLQDMINEAWTSIDNMNRVAVYVEAIKRGSSRQEAADLARLAAFDYGHLTDFERERMRHIVLFYGFMRQNIRLWWWTMLNHPDRVLGQLRMAGGLQRAWVEEEPDITVPDYLDGRFMLWFRNASIDAYGQGVATIAPPIPAADVINLFSELAGMASMEQPSWQDAIGRLDPKLQVPIALATGLDPRTNRDLLDQAKVPNWMVEGDRLLSGGQLTDVVLQVENITNRDPTRDSYDDSGYYRAKNKVAWLVLRTVLQVPPFGRSMDTLEKIDRAAPFGEPGPISTAVNALQAYRQAGGNPELDAFFRTVAPVLLKPLALMSDDVPPPVMPPLANPPDDMAPARPGMTQAEERGGVLGFTPVRIGSPEEEQDRMLESIRREAEHEGKDTAKGATYPRR